MIATMTTFTTALLLRSSSFFFFVVSPSWAFSTTPPPPPPPSWEALQSTPSLTNRPPPPIYHNTLPDSADLSLPVLYRDKDCICAACESVWLALEVKNVNYLTVLVDKQLNEDEPIPRISWPTKAEASTDDDTGTTNNNNNNNDIITDPVKLLEQIQAHYPNTSPHFYPQLSSAVDASRCNILRLPGVMPRNSDETLLSLAPYLFRSDGTMVPSSSHVVSLEEVEEMQEEYYRGDFLCGKEITGADIIWTPYLERYAVQLPLIFPNNNHSMGGGRGGRLDPRNRNVYGEVDNWYMVMEREVPAYSCRVMGDARHWRKCLEVAVNIHNERVVVVEKEEEEEDNNRRRVSLPNVPEESGWWIKKKKTKKNGSVADTTNKAGEIWKEYCSQQRPWLADSPSGEVALFLMRNREMIVNSAVVVNNNNNTSDYYFDSDNTADEALRELIQVLVDWDIYFDQSKSSEDEMEQPTLSERGRKMALFVAEEVIQVPRDIGMIPSSALWEMIWSCG
jgi:hypothetical protein